MVSFRRGILYRDSCIRHQLTRNMMANMHVLPIGRIEGVFEHPDHRKRQLRLANINLLENTSPCKRRFFATISYCSVLHLSSRHTDTRLSPQTSSDARTSSKHGGTQDLSPTRCSTCVIRV